MQGTFRRENNLYMRGSRAVCELRGDVARLTMRFNASGVMSMPSPYRLFVLAVCLSLAVCLWLPATVAGDETAPPGVRVEVVAEDAPAAPRGERLEQLDRADGDEQHLDLSYEGVPFGQVLDDLEDKLDVIILCDDTRLLRLSYYRRIVVPESAALAVICGSVLQYPRPMHILCFPDEVRDGRTRPEIRTDKLINVELQDAQLGPALDWIRRTTGVGVAASETVVEEVVSYAAEGVTVAQAVEEIAQAAGLAHTTGFSVQPVEFERELERLENLSDEDLNRLFSEGLRRFDEVRGEMNGGDAQLQTQVQSGLEDGMRVFGGLEPHERREIIQRGARLIERFARLTQRLEPETRERLGQFAQPIAALAVAGYIALPPQTRAELAPIMRALQGFQW